MLVTGHDDARRVLLGREFLPAVGAALDRDVLECRVSAPAEGLVSGRELAGVAGPGVVRALALLACHARECATAVKEIATGGPTPYLRGCLVEGLRLWPCEPYLHRVTGGEVDWHGTPLAGGTRIEVPVALAGPEREFAPWYWLNTRVPADLCSERRLDLGTAALAALLPERGYELLGADLWPGKPLPQTLDVHRLRFAVHRVGPAVPRAARPPVPRQREVPPAPARTPRP
ncbi:MAG: hypothetical protein HOY71_07600 [Nonomuraea sp.]|nr:hypothetical protein [Nonomuraea sp.]